MYINKEKIAKCIKDLKTELSKSDSSESGKKSYVIQMKVLFKKYPEMSGAVIKLSTTWRWREKASREVVSQMDRITGY